MEIRIFGKTFVIKKCSREQVDGNDGIAGNTAQEIYIANDLTEESSGETLLHELIHLVDWELEPPEKRLKEEQVHRISRSLWTVLKDNPWLIAVILGETDYE